MSDIKLCKDCKHCMALETYFYLTVIDVDYRNAYCELSENMMDGTPDVKCKDYRSAESLCGKEAKYFEAK